MKYIPQKKAQFCWHDLHLFSTLSSVLTAYQGLSQPSCKLDQAKCSPLFIGYKGEDILHKDPTYISDQY